MSGINFWRRLSKECFEHSTQMLLAIEHIIKLIPDPDGTGQEAHDLLKMIGRLERLHNADTYQEIKCLDDGYLAQNSNEQKAA